MSIQEYNGWKNKETWVVAMWIANDEKLYRKVQAMAKGQDELRYMVQDMMEAAYNGPGNGLIVDLQAETLDRIEWASIEESLIYVASGKETKQTASVYLVSDAQEQDLGEVEIDKVKPKDAVRIMRLASEMALGSTGLIDENGVPAWLEIRDEHGAVLCSDKKETK